jgi:hypothetical protein
MLSGVLEAECQAQVSLARARWADQMHGFGAVDELQFERDSNSWFGPTAPGSFPVFGFRGFAGSLSKHPPAKPGALSL